MEQRFASAELLAPAGSFEGVRYAVGAGADAVYFGAGDFHARRAAQGIDLAKTVEYCHLFGVKAYLTLNIIVKDSEFERVAALIEAAFQAKIDAFIVTDLGILNLLKIYAPGVPLHASTQMGVAAKAGAELLKELGFARVVLAREAGIEEIRAVKSTGIEVETFVHGALCVAYSGACLLSSIKSGDSGNRGVCKQPCRMRYRLRLGNRETAEGYFLSPKDQCLLSRLAELRAAGVDSFKIEGRLKRDVYAGGVTGVYREILDGKVPEDLDFDRLKRLFQRGEFTQGYAFDQSRRIIYPYFQGHLGVKVGEILSVGGGKAHFETSIPLDADDGFKVLRGGAEAQGVTIGAVESEGHGRYRFTADGVKKGDEIRLTDDADLDRKIAENVNKLPVFMRVLLVLGRSARIDAEASGVRVSVEGDAPEAARSEALSAEAIRIAVEKLGGTEFEAKRTEVVTNGVFYRKSALNALRRAAIEALRAEIVKKNTPDYASSDGEIAHISGGKPTEKTYENYGEFMDAARCAHGDFAGVLREDFGGETGNRRGAVYAEVECLNQAFAVPDDGRAVVVFRPKRYRVEDAKAFSDQFRKARRGAPLYLFTPPMILEKDAAELTKMLAYFDGAVANSLSAMKIVRDAKKRAVAGMNLNLSNRENPLIEGSDAHVMSVELNERERFGEEGAAVYAYGRLPLMYLRHCPKKTSGIDCKNCMKEDRIELIDGKYRFPIERFESGGECRFRLLNSVNTDLGIYARGYIPYLDFGGATCEEIAEIYREYAEETRVSRGDYTLLHTKRGVK